MVTQETCLQSLLICRLTWPLNQIKGESCLSAATIPSALWNKSQKKWEMATKLTITSPTSLEASFRKRMDGSVPQMTLLKSWQRMWCSTRPRLRLSSPSSRACPWQTLMKSRWLLWVSRVGWDPYLGVNTSPSWSPRTNTCSSMVGRTITPSATAMKQWASIRLTQIGWPAWSTTRSPRPASTTSCCSTCSHVSGQPLLSVASRLRRVGPPQSPTTSLRISSLSSVVRELMAAVATMYSVASWTRIAQITSIMSSRTISKTLKWQASACWARLKKEGRPRKSRSLLLPTASLEAQQRKCWSDFFSWIRSDSTCY